MIIAFVTGYALMEHTSPSESSTLVAKDAAAMRPLQPVTLSERSLTLLALMRIFVELLWFQ